MVVGHGLAVVVGYNCCYRFTGGCEPNIVPMWVLNLKYH